MTVVADLPRARTTGTYTTRRVVGAALTCLALVVGATVFGVVGSVIGIMTLSVPVGVVARTVLVLGVLALVLVLGYRWSLGGPRPLWLLAGIVAYLLLPAAWSGRALIASLLGLTGVAAWALDALVWVVAVALVVRSRPAIHDDRIDTSGLR